MRETKRESDRDRKKSSAVTLYELNREGTKACINITGKGLRCQR